MQDTINSLTAMVGDYYDGVQDNDVQDQYGAAALNILNSVRPIQVRNIDTALETFFGKLIEDPFEDELRQTIQSLAQKYGLSNLNNLSNPNCRMFLLELDQKVKNSMLPKAIQYNKHKATLIPLGFLSILGTVFTIPALLPAQLSHLGAGVFLPFVISVAITVAAVKLIQILRKQIATLLARPLDEQGLAQAQNLEFLEGNLVRTVNGYLQPLRADLQAMEVVSDQFRQRFYSNHAEVERVSLGDDASPKKCEKKRQPSVEMVSLGDDNSPEECKEKPQPSVEMVSLGDDNSPKEHTEEPQFNDDHDSVTQPLLGGPFGRR